MINKTNLLVKNKMMKIYQMNKKINLKIKIKKLNKIYNKQKIKINKISNLFKIKININKYKEIFIIIMKQKIKKKII